jgi:16S rRNA (cytosine1407-C5)-methyltransferase
MPHPFDRYADFTDLAALKEASSKPLRKSMRVNTLKTSVEKFREWGSERNWQMEQVPWCDEAFFIDREDRTEALGKDLLHLLGHTYMQEAASMLPVELLDPQPGEKILDMSAAPGSKSTQIAAKMQGRGVVIANDVQEKRLWTLKSALHRLGVTNVLVTRKVGQWFSKHMTERFDRVLCDAPCTAQGTARKDSDALDYCSPENIGKMASLQKELLSAAINATKIGGTIVYSTCTLTPEENEGVIAAMMHEFEGKIEIVDPLTIAPRFQSLKRGVEDSFFVQEKIGASQKYPCVRLWPHTYDVEGFFCAVLKKVAPTRHKEQMDIVRLQEEELPKIRRQQMGKALEDQYGSSFIREDERLFERNDQLILTTDEVANFKMPVADYSIGLPFARRVDTFRLRIDHEIATLRGAEATSNRAEISDDQLNALFDGKDTTCNPSLSGDVILMYKGLAVGVGLAREGKLKNRLPRWVVQKS